MIFMDAGVLHGVQYAITAFPAKPENVHRIATIRRPGGRKDREIR